MNNRQELNTTQKILAGVLLLFGFFVFFFWYLNLKNDLRVSIGYDDNNNTTVCSNGDCTVNNNVNNIKLQDTDGDGLSDYDELNVYGTFPYIKDTDSDGIDDKTEIDNDTDPKCPEGNDCSNDAIKNSEEMLVKNNSTLDRFKNFDFSTIKIDKKMASSTAMDNVISGKSNVKEIRKVLEEAGVNKKILDAMSDDILLKSYNDVLNK